MHVHTCMYNTYACFIMVTHRNQKHVDAILFLALCTQTVEALQSVALDAAAALMLAQTRQAALYFRAPEALEHLGTFQYGWMDQ